MALRCSALRRFSNFAVSPETVAPPHGQPRGRINELAGLGLPPWAAWSRNTDRESVYRMLNVKPTWILPRRPTEMDQVWENERIQERYRTSGTFKHCFRQLKHPYMTTGVWYSDVLDHWIQIPHVSAATLSIERAGGLDNYILSRPGERLMSRYGERLRRHIIARQKEIQKNFVLEMQSQHLGSVVAAELGACKDAESARAVVAKYGLSPAFFAKLAEKQAAAAAAKAASAARTA